MTRRETLAMAGAGFGWLGLQGAALAADGRGPLAVKEPHHAARAKHVIFLFLNGGVSQVDTFDPKPELTTPERKTAPRATCENRQRHWQSDGVAVRVSQVWSKRDRGQ